MKTIQINFCLLKTRYAIYTVKDLQEAVYSLGDHEGTPKNRYDDIGMKTKLISTRFGLTFGMLRFDERSFCNILL